jgi:hypothetical protein
MHVRGAALNYVYGHTNASFKHVQLDKTPRKKRKTLGLSTLHSLDAPPKPSGVIPALVPVETLQDWGLQCSVPPSEVTLDDLMSRMINEDETSV